MQNPTLKRPLLGQLNVIWSGDWSLSMVTAPHRAKASLRYCETKKVDKSTWLCRLKFTPELTPEAVDELPQLRSISALAASFHRVRTPHQLGMAIVIPRTFWLDVKVITKSTGV
jgi:hypothetical protein